MNVLKNNEVTIAVVSRFFAAIDRLIADKVLGGVKTFTDRYGINRWNFQSMKKDYTMGGAFQLCWLSYLVSDFHVSAYWLLCGTGDFYAQGWTAEIIKKLQINRREKSA